MKKVFGLAIFAAGAAIGSVASWYITKMRYEQIIQEEIDSVKEVFSKHADEIVVEVCDDEPEEDISEPASDAAERAKDKPNVIEYTKNLRDNGYSNEIVVERPYVVSPDEFGEIDEYEKISLIYFADQILTDDGYDLVEDVEDVIGFDSLNHFGEYEEDSVFVRNDRLKADYEILMDMRRYSDVIKTKPHLVEV